MPIQLNKENDGKLVISEYERIAVAGENIEALLTDAHGNGEPIGDFNSTRAKLTELGLESDLDTEGRK